MPSVDISCDDFVVAEPAYVAERLAEESLWQTWWPRLRLTPYDRRGLEGVRWTVAGELDGTAEFWLERFRDGVVVHWYLRADPAGSTGRKQAERLRKSYQAGYRRNLWRLKDELEHGRETGARRRGARATIVSAGSPEAGSPERGASMAEQTTSSIVVNATPDRIMDVIADFEAYPTWADSMSETEVLSTDAAGRAEQVRFKMDAGPISDEYTLAYTWASNEVRWNLVQAKMVKGMDGAYVLKDLGDGSTEVTYRLAVDVSIPMIGMLKRKAEKVIIDTALKGLKKRVES